MAIVSKSFATALSASETDDYPSNTSTSGVVVVNAAASSGTIETTGDTDYFQVTLNAGQQYRFGIAGGSKDSTYSSVALTLRRPDGSLISSTPPATSSKSGNSRSIDYTPETSGTYYLEASDPINLGSYKVRAITLFDGLPDTNSTSRMTVGESANGRIQTSGEIDRFGIDLVAGTAYDFVLSATSAGGLVDPNLTLVSSYSVIAVEDDNAAGNGKAHIGFIAPKSGRYYLVAGSASAGTGDYVLSAKVGGDDFAGSIATQGQVALDGSATNGVLEHAGDSDYLRVQLTAGSHYLFDLDGTGALTDTHLRLRGADGNVILSNDAPGGSKGGGTASSALSYTAGSSGAYYLDVSSDTDKAGSYTLRAVVDDFPDTPQTSGVVIVDGGASHGALQSAHDSDRFSVVLTADAVYQFSLAPAGDLQARLQLYGPDGASLTSYLWESSSGVFAYRASSSGTYYLGVSSTGSMTGDYLLSATIGPDDYPASTNTPGVLALNGDPLPAVIDWAGDVDYFKVDLVAGTPYVLVASGSKDPVNDTFLRLHAPDGSVVASDDDSMGTTGGAAMISYIAPASGTYYLDVSSDSNQTGHYQAIAMVDDVPDWNGAFRPISVGGDATSGGLERPDDHDRFRITLETGRLYDFAAVSPGDAIDLRVQLIDATGKYREHGLNGMDASIHEGGIFYVDVSSMVYPKTGGYSLRVSAAPDDFLAATTTGGTVFAGGAAATGNIDRGNDADYFKVSLNAGVTYTFDLRGDGSGNLVDTQLALHAADNTVLVSDDDSGGGSKNGPARINYTPSASGTYYLEAMGNGVQTGGYLLTARDKPMAAALLGTAGDDAMPAFPDGNTYRALEGNDRIAPGRGNDEIDGGTGLDTVVLEGARSGYSVHRHGAIWIVDGGTTDADTLTDVERLQFSDRGTALDLQGAAGSAARLVGAVFGKAYVGDAALVGQYLARFDGGESAEALVERALSSDLFLGIAGSRSNADVVEHVFVHVVGRQATAEEAAYYTGLLDNGAYTQAGLVWMGAGTDVNAATINLAGLADTGLDYLPSTGS